MRVPRSRRKEQVLEFLYSQGRVGAMRREIAGALGQTKSPFILSLMNEMVAEGLAVGDVDYEVYPPGWRYWHPSFAPVKE
jgi:hypothetical protein